MSFRTQGTDHPPISAGVHIEHVPTADADVVARYESAVRRFCRSRNRTPEDADDAVQDTFLRYLRRPATAVRNPEAWLITAASRACSDINRRNGRDDARQWVPSITRNGSVEGLDRIADTSHSTEPEAATVDLIVVKHMLRALFPRERRVVTHLYLFGTSHEELARYLGVSTSSLRTIAMRARRHAQQILRRQETFPPS